MHTEVDISVIIVNYNTEALLPKAIGKLRTAVSSFSLQIIIIDNDSRDDSVALIKRDYPDCVLIENKSNVGFGRANNQAIPLIQGRYVLLLNTDAFVESDTVDKTVAYLDKHEEIGLLGVKLIGRDGSLQPSCRYFPTPLNLFVQRLGLQFLFPWLQVVDDMTWDHGTSRECDWVPGCYLLIRREVIEQVGLFDERYFLYSEEVDMCFAAKKAGWKVCYFSDTSVVHLGGESAKSDGEVTASGSQIEALQIESELLYFRKNHGLVAVTFHVLLQTLFGGILAVKGTLKGKPVGDGYIRIKSIWSLFGKTCWGSKSTR